MEFHRLLKRIVQDGSTHAKWLNTLSFMENAGARKISKCEHPVLVSQIQLKHAAEEHRHAYYLKKQISKIDPELCKTYEDQELLASIATRQYLHSLDMKACRYLQDAFKLNKEDIKYAAYLFVTYAIEVRADELYPVYQQVLTEESSRIMVKSIILEEEGHLEEMINQLNEFSTDWKLHAENIVMIEKVLHEQWISAITEEVGKLDYA